MAFLLLQRAETAIDKRAMVSRLEAVEASGAAAVPLGRLLGHLYELLRDYSKLVKAVLHSAGGESGQIFGSLERLFDGAGGGGRAGGDAAAKLAGMRDAVKKTHDPPKSCKSARSSRILPTHGSIVGFSGTAPHPSAGRRGQRGRGESDRPAPRRENTRKSDMLLQIRGRSCGVFRALVLSLQGLLGPHGKLGLRARRRQRPAVLLPAVGAVGAEGRGDCRQVGRAERALRHSALPVRPQRRLRLSD